MSGKRSGLSGGHWLTPLCGERRAAWQRFGDMARARRRFAPAIAFALSAGFLAATGCGGKVAPEPPPPPPTCATTACAVDATCDDADGTTTPVCTCNPGYSGDGVSCSDKPVATLGTEGGEVSVQGGPSVSVPAGALAEPTTIAISTPESSSIDANSQAPDDVYLSDVMTATPHGVQFLIPVTISMPVGPKVTRIYRRDDEDDRTWDLIEEVTFADGMAIFEVMSFSQFGGGAALTKCTPTEYETRAPAPGSDRVCSPLPTLSTTALPAIETSAADVSLHRGGDGPVGSVDYKLIPGTALPGIDYVDSTGTIDFPAGGGALTEILSVELKKNDNFEFDEVFVVELSNPIGLVFEDGAATLSTPVSIVDVGSSLAVDTVDGENGFRLDGAPGLGHAVSGAGDLNGDGVDDVVIGAQTSGGVTETGAYVVFGKATVGPDATSFAPLVDLVGLNGDDGFGVQGILGLSLSAGFDANGDGLGDIIFGSSFKYDTANIIFGSASPFASTFDTRTLDGDNGFKLTEAGFSKYTESVSGAGDINGDGLDDIIVGNAVGGGVAFVVYGRQAPNAFTAALDVGTLDSSSGFYIDGAEGSGPGSEVNSAGDVNNDGAADLIIGSPRNGKFYVVYGKRAGETGFGERIDLTTLDPADGFSMSTAHTTSVMPVVSAGDVNGDGFDDILIGNHSQNQALVVFGSATAATSPIDLDALDGTNGFTLLGGHDMNIDGAEGGLSGAAGTSVSGLGDFDGDQIADIAIGERGLNRVSVVFGRKGPDAFGSTLDLDSLDGTQGFFLDGPANIVDGAGSVGVSVAQAGDVNGDGYPDVILGAPDNAATFVVFGGKRTKLPSTD